MPILHKRSLVAVFSFLVLGVMSCALFVRINFNGPHLVENQDYIVYIPGHINRHGQYPLVVVLSPSGDARGMINAWKGVADKFKWVILSSKRFYNGIPYQNELNVFKEISGSVQKGLLTVPIDQKRILASGISGGGWGAHDFVFFFPKFIDGVIINTGMMDAEWFYPRKNEYPREKMAVFLASQSDFRYNEMKRDRVFLESLGWKTKWIEFQGGHVLAPQEVYLQAAQWVDEQWKK